MARSSGAGSAGGRISMVGNSTTPAPSAERREASAPACSLARVTTIRLPNSGRRSNQSSLWRRRTTSPTMMVAGGFIPASRAGSLDNVPTMVCWSARVAQRTARLHSGEQGGEPGQRADDGLLVGSGGPAHGHGGSVGRAPVVDELAGDFGERGESHEDHQGFGVADFGPIDCLHGVP